MTKSDSPIRRTIMMALTIGTIAASTSLAAAAVQSSARRADVTAPPGGQLVDGNGAPSRDAAAPQLPAAVIEDAAAQPTQITPRRARNDATPQLNRERRNARAGAQLYQGRRTAQSSEPLSRPAEGRRQGLVRIAGKDRCDPATSGSKPAEACEHVIETRAAEFERRSPLILSPEQRLLVDQRLRDAPSTAEMAVRRIGRNDIDADAADAQSVASLVLNQAEAARVETPQTPASALDPTTVTGALVQAIIDSTQSSQPR